MSVMMFLSTLEVKQPIFVVEHCNNDLILERSWERMMRTEYINEDDGSYTIKIRSPNGRRMMQFWAMKAEHERNREFARHTHDGQVGSHSLKG